MFIPLVYIRNRRLFGFLGVMGALMLHAARSSHAATRDVPVTHLPDLPNAPLPKAILPQGDCLNPPDEEVRQRIEKLRPVLRFAGNSVPGSGNGSVTCVNGKLR